VHFLSVRAVHFTLQVEEGSELDKMKVAYDFKRLLARYNPTNRAGLHASRVISFFKIKSCFFSRNSDSLKFQKNTVRIKAVKRPFFLPAERCE
jgi:hypothetical protein